MKKGLKKAYEITDAKIQFVSLVDKAANKRKQVVRQHLLPMAELLKLMQKIITSQELCMNLWKKIVMVIL